MVISWIARTDGKSGRRENGFVTAAKWSAGSLLARHLDQGFPSAPSLVPFLESTLGEASAVRDSAPSIGAIHEAPFHTGIFIPLCEAIAISSSSGIRAKAPCCLPFAIVTRYGSLAIAPSAHRAVMARTVSTLRKELILSRLQKMNIENLDRPVRMSELTGLVGMSRSWIYSAMARSEFPKPDYRFGRNSVAWSMKVLLKWLEDHRNNN